MSTIAFYITSWFWEAALVAESIAARPIRWLLYASPAWNGIAESFRARQEPK
jgi:hypothetical protein